ncbi:MAG: hypothetical protein IJS01_03620 [Lentisphaeria bacterium]|nr:hypothetical protein [Lentisphaeria bacterium]
MKIKLLGKNLDDIRPVLRSFGLEECDRDFELIVTHGGDGALLGAERDYPGIPKFPLRDAATASPCPRHDAKTRLEELVSGKAVRTLLPKVAARARGKESMALNDVFIHNFDRGSALRYRVRIDGELYAHEIVGDGVCLSSVHGSSAYYRSITHSLFRVGIGLAFSNSTEEVNHLVLDPGSRVEIEIVRGPGLLVTDNALVPETIPVGDTVELYQSEQCAVILGLDGFMCKNCRLLRHPHKQPFSGMV